MLEEEQMAQAGQPQKLEEDLDQQQQQEEDEPEAPQPDETAAERDGSRPQQVSCPPPSGQKLQSAKIWGTFGMQSLVLLQLGSVLQLDKCLTYSRSRVVRSPPAG